MCLPYCVFVQGVIVRWLLVLCVWVCECVREWTGISAPSHPRWTWSVKQHWVLWAPCSVGSIPWHTYPVSCCFSSSSQEDDFSLNLCKFLPVVSVQGVGAAARIWPVSAETQSQCVSLSHHLLEGNRSSKAKDILITAFILWKDVCVYICACMQVSAEARGIWSLELELVLKLSDVGAWSLGSPGAYPPLPTEPFLQPATFILF